MYDEHTRDFFSRLFFFAEKNPRNFTQHWLLKQKYFCFQAQSQAIPRGIETACVYKNFGAGNTMKVVLPSQRQGSGLILRRLTS